MLVKNGCEEEKQNAKAAIDAADGHGRAAAFAAKLKETDLRKGDFAQDFLDTVETSDNRLQVPVYLETALRWLTAAPTPAAGA